MGNKSTKNNKQPLIKHEKFQTLKIINEEEMLTEIRLTLDDYNLWKTNLKKINSFNKENILIPLNHSFEKQGWCSENTGIIKITYDNYQFIFEEELENRITLNKHLSEEQMWYLLYTLVSTAKDFSFLNKKVGDIRPHNIFVSQAGQIKLGVCFSWPNEHSNYQKTLNDKQITYASPQQLKICKNKNLDNLINNITSESFSIGLTMLHAGLLFNFASIYNLQKFQINTKLLEEKIQNWMKLEFQNQDDVKVNYSNSLKEIIKNLCIVQASNRQTSIQIYKLLQPYREQILNIEQFQLNYSRQHLPQQKQEKNRVSSENQIYNYATFTQGHPNISSSVNHTSISNVKPPFSIAVLHTTDWSRGSLTPLALNLGGQKPHSSTHYSHSYDVFNKYSNSNNSHSIIQHQNQNFLFNSSNNNSGLRQTHFDNNKTNSNFHSQQKHVFTHNFNDNITVKPFEAKIEQETVKYTVPVNLNSIIEKEAINQQSSYATGGIGIGYKKAPPFKDFTHQIQKVQAWKTQPYPDYTDFLRKIDEQIHRSRNLFPS